ncbi:MAG: protein translocase subunit SecD [Alphaproteobacteria bacterium]|nr:protein translocase subunit SecD [Alphaproteobacteria bacterium]
MAIGKKGKNMKRWKLLIVIMCAVWGILMVLPTFLPSHLREKIPSWLPQKTMTLGLDLSGGIHLSMDVDTENYIQQRCHGVADFLRPILLQEKILYRNMKPEPYGASFVLLNQNDVDRLKKVTGEMNGTPLELIQSHNGQCIIQVPEFERQAMAKEVLGRSIEIIRKRIDETGALEPAIYAQGNRQIIVQIPGFDDPDRVRMLLGKTAQLAFHWVGDAHDVHCTTMPYCNMAGRSVAVEKKPVMLGEEILRSGVTYQSRDYGGEIPVVTLEFTPKGRALFANLTRTENHKRALAIVIDGEVLSTPAIQSHITNGSAVISGNMTTEEAQQLATMINSGALPAPLLIQEEKLIGPGLGNDSIVAGTRGTALAVAAVGLWMILTYAYFGCFAVLGITFNLLFLVSLLIMIGATLTLPGLAGIALTVGMSVDANVLINERIKEELHKGTSVPHAIAAGYSRAMKSILDSNITTLIGALCLYICGSGPVRGFAVTMGMGILISLFTAILLTRLLVNQWMAWKNPKTLSI